MRRMLVLLCALLIPVAYGRAEENATVVEKGGTRATVTAPPFDTRDPAAFIEVAITSQGRTKTWRYDQIWLDPEETGVPAAEIFTAGHRDFLFVHTYTGGASCCWSMLVFDLRDLKPLPGQVRSASPIKLVTSGSKCELGAPILPTTTVPSGPHGFSFYCFDGEKFSKPKRGAPRSSNRSPASNPR